MTYEQIEEELKDFEGDVFFVSLDTSFVWDEKSKKAVPYNTTITKENSLVVKQTIAIDLGTLSLKNFLEKHEVSSKDTLVFCINEDLYPKKRGNWIRLTIMKDVKEEKPKIIRKNKKEENDEE